MDFNGFFHTQTIDSFIWYPTPYECISLQKRKHNLHYGKNLQAFFASLLCRLRADPSRCNSSNKQNSLIQQNHQHFWTSHANFYVLWDYGLMIFQCLFTIVKNWNIVLLLCLWHIDSLENLGKVRTSSHTLITRSHSTFRRDTSMV